MNCENCNCSPTSAPMVQFWKQYRVGGIDSTERFYLCPDCQDEVDPIELWANQATVTTVKA